MSQKSLNIICFENPFPANYGGVIDVFFKIKAFHELGIKIHLHCFVYENEDVSQELLAITEKIYFYRKIRNPFYLFSKIPFGVKSRFNINLLINLKENKFPILFEGLQTTMVINFDNFENRKLFLRLHNLENNYYSGLSNSEKNWPKKLLYFSESIKYKYYLKQINRFEKVFTLSKNENNFVIKHFNNALYVPVFQGNIPEITLSEFGEYVLFQGDLRIADNWNSLIFFINIFKELKQINFKIASNFKKKNILKIIDKHQNIEYVEIKNEEHFNEVLANAHINVMSSSQESGTKLKLINALFKSRHCVINKNMIDDEKILKYCHVAVTESDFIKNIIYLNKQPFDNSKSRFNVISEVFDDKINAEKIIKSIFKK